jgi:hypothetical protein
LNGIVGRKRARLPSWLRTKQRRPGLLAELKRRQAATSRPLRAKALPHWLRSGLVDELGSVNAARELLGLDTIISESVAPSRVVPEIKARHVRGESLAYTHVPRALVTAATAKFGSWPAAIEAAGLDYTKLGLKVKRYSDDELLDRLRATAKAHPQMSLLKLSKERHYRSTVDRFGGWRRAMKRAGLSNWPIQQKGHWTKQAIIDGLRAVARSGKSASTDPNLCNAAKRHFGSLQAAALVAGVRTRVPRAMSREEVIAKLRAIARAHGTVTNAVAYKARVRNAAVTQFGTLTAACEAAGVTGFRRLLATRHAEQDDPRRSLEQLRKIASKLGRPVTRRDLSWTLDQTLLRHFGSLERARERAGLPQPKRPTRWDRKRVLAELRHEHQRGTRMTRKGLIAAGRQDLLSAVTVYVGTFEHARRLARIPTPKPLASSHVPFLKIWDEDRVIEEINRRAAKGKSLVPSTIPRSLMAAACRYWGSWRNATEVAGHDYTKIVLRRDRTDDELLDLLRTIAKLRPHMTLDQLRGLPVAATLYRRFGTPDVAARRAGLSAWPKREALPVLLKPELRDLLLERIRKGQPISASNLDRHVRFSMSRIHPVWSVAFKRLRLGTASTRMRARGSGA